MLLGWSARRGVLAAGVAGGLASLGCGDLFHGTEWVTACDGDNPAPQCAAATASGGAGGTGASGGGSSGTGGAPPATSCSSRFGDATEQHLASLTLDGDDAALVVGRFSGAVAFGDHNLESAGLEDAFVAKLDTECNVVYAKSFGANDADEAVGNAVDSANNHYVAGSFRGVVDFGDGAVDAGSISDGFLVKLDSTGALLWKQVLTAQTQPLRMRALAVMGDDVVLAGDSDSSVAGDTDMFVVAFDAQGNDRWIKSFGGPGNDVPLGIGITDDGHVWVSGNFEASVDFGGGALTSEGGTDVFVLELDNNGNHVQSHRFGDALDQEGNNLAAAPGGGVVIAGSFAGTIDFGRQVLSSAGASDAYVARLDASGDLMWAHAFGGAADDHARSVTVGADGQIVVSGEFAASAAFGVEQLVSAGEQDAFVVISSAGGDVTTSLGFGDAASQAAFGAARDSAGQLVVGGDFAGEVDFGEGMLKSVGGGDMFLARTSAR